MTQLKITQENQESNVITNNENYSVIAIEDGIYQLISDGKFNEKTNAIIGYLSDDFTLSPCVKYVDANTLEFRTGQVRLWQSLGIILYLHLNNGYNSQELSIISSCKALLYGSESVKLIELADTL